MPFHDEPTLMFRDGSSLPVTAMLASPILMEQRLLRWLKVAHQFPGDRGSTLLEGVIRYYGVRLGADAWARFRIDVVSRNSRSNARAFGLALVCALIESGLAPIPVPLWQSDDAVNLDTDGVLRDSRGIPIDAGGKLAAVTA